MITVHEMGEATNILNTLRTLGNQIKKLMIEIKEMENGPQKNLKRKKLEELINGFWKIAKENKKLLKAAGITSAIIASLIYGGAKFRKYQLSKKENEKKTNESTDFTYNPFISENKIKKRVIRDGIKVINTERKYDLKNLNKYKSIGDNHMTTELLEFVLVEALKKEGIMEKSMPLKIFLKKNGKNLSLEEVGTILYLIDEIEKSAERRILSETEKQLRLLKEDWETSYDKKRRLAFEKEKRDAMLKGIKGIPGRIKKNFDNREELLNKAKDRLSTVRKWAGQHKAATAGIAAASLAAGTGAAMLRRRALKKKAEKEEELKKQNKLR